MNKIVLSVVLVLAVIYGVPLIAASIAAALAPDQTSAGKAGRC